MSEYRYTHEDRIDQLSKLIPALQSLIVHMKRENLFVDKVHQYESALAEAERLLMKGFTQSELSELDWAVPDLFYRHKAWSPPLEDESNPYSKPAKWFGELEKYLQPARVAASVLSIIGYY